MEAILGISCIDQFDQHMFTQLPVPSCEGHRVEEAFPSGIYYLFAHV